MVCVDQALPFYVFSIHIVNSVGRQNFFEAHCFVKLLRKMPHVNGMVWNKESGREGGERRNGKSVIDMELFSSHKCMAGNNVEEQILMRPERWFYFEERSRSSPFFEKEAFLSCTKTKQRSEACCTP